MPIWWEKDLNDYLNAKHDKAEKMLRTRQEECAMKQRFDTIDEIHRQEEAEANLLALHTTHRAELLVIGCFGLFLALVIAVAWVVLS